MEEDSKGAWGYCEVSIVVPPLSLDLELSDYAGIRAACGVTGVSSVSDDQIYGFLDTDL